MPFHALAETAPAETEMPVKIVLFPFHEAIVSSTIPAKVVSYKVKEGQTFASGETIACLDDRNYRQAFFKAKAAVLEAQSGFKFAESNLARTKELFSKNAIGLQELDQATLERDVADSKLQYANANFELAKIDLDACSIKVPFNGRLTKKTIRENEYIGVGQPLLEAIDDSSLLAVMHLPAAYSRAIKIGDEMSFKVDETGAICKGKVFTTSGRIDFESRTFEVKLLVENSSRALTAGMSGVLLPVGGKALGGL